MKTNHFSKKLGVPVILILIESAVIPTLAQADNLGIYAADHCPKGDPLCFENDKPLPAASKDRPQTDSSPKNAEANPQFQSDQSQITRPQAPDQRGAPAIRAATQSNAAQTKDTADGYEYDFNDDHGDGKRLKSEDVLKIRRHSFDYVIIPSIDCQLPKEVTDQYPTLHGVTFDRSICEVKKPVVVKVEPPVTINPMSPNFRVELNGTRAYDSGGVSSVNGVFPNSALVHTGIATLHLTIPTSGKSGLNLSGGGGVTDEGGQKLSPVLSEAGIEYYGDVGDMNHKPVMAFATIGQDPARGVSQAVRVGGAFEGGFGEGYRDVTHSAYLAPGGGLSAAFVYSVDVGSTSYSSWTGAPRGGIDLSLLNLKISAEYCAQLNKADSLLLCPTGGATLRLGGALTTGPGVPSPDSNINAVTALLEAGANLAYVDKRAATGEIKRYFYVGPTASGATVTSASGTVKNWEVGFTAGMANF